MSASRRTCGYVPPIAAFGAATPGTVSAASSNRVCAEAPGRTDRRHGAAQVAGAADGLECVDRVPGQPAAGHVSVVRVSDGESGRARDTREGRELNCA